MRMKAADTRASSAIVPCTPLAVAFRSWTTYEIETFISDVSKTSTNIAIESRTASLVEPVDAASSTGMPAGSDPIPRAV